MKKPFLVLATTVALSGCAADLPAVGPLSAASDPARPEAPIMRAAYSPVTAGYVSFPIVEPGDWRELNRRVTPAPKRDGGGEGHAH